MTGTSKKSHGEENRVAVFSSPPVNEGLVMINDALRCVAQRDVAINDIVVIKFCGEYINVIVDDIETAGIPFDDDMITGHHLPSNILYFTRCQIVDFCTDS